MTKVSTQKLTFSPLRIAQRAVAEPVYIRVTLSLREHPCVSYALSCCGTTQWSSLDVAVKLMLAITDDDYRCAEQLSLDVNQEWITGTQIDAGEKALADCIALLEQTNCPFTLIGHVYGTRLVKYRCLRDGHEFPLTTIANAVASEVISFGRGEIPVYCPSPSIDRNPM